MNTEGSVMNWVKGVIRAHYVGLVRAGLRISVGERIDLRVRWAKLDQQVEAGTVYTVKVHGQEWTLKSFGPVTGAQRPSKPWDDVNIVVDPQAVELSIVAPCYIVRQS